MTAQESSEDTSRITNTAFGNGPELCTRSQTSNCRNSPPTHESINQAPSGSCQYTPAAKTMISRRRDFFRPKKQNYRFLFYIFSMTQSRRRQDSSPLR